MSGFGKWDKVYAHTKRYAPGLYGAEKTYELAAGFLADCTWVEDWGCGRGGFTAFCSSGYRGVDGSKTPFADEVVDLLTYRSSAPGILLRHVLEHNEEWEQILAGAVASFRHKLCVINATPMQDGPDVVRRHPNVCGVPDIALSRPRFEAHLAGLKWHALELHTGSIQGSWRDGRENVYYIEREAV